jgi:hypothetical protein
MPAPTITLPKGSILAIEAETKANIYVSSSNLMYVEVSTVSDLCENYALGDIVVINPRDSGTLIYSDKTYFFILESNIKYKES